MATEYDKTYFFDRKQNTKWNLCWRSNERRWITKRKISLLCITGSYP
jgi:hypothetical protein